MRKRVLSLTLALAACVPLDPIPVPIQDTCRASALQDLVGQPRAVLDAMQFTQPVRIIPEGGVVTLDFSPSRLNFELDGVGRIEHVFCG